MGMMGEMGEMDERVSLVGTWKCDFMDVHLRIQSQGLGNGVMKCFVNESSMGGRGETKLA